RTTAERIFGAAAIHEIFIFGSRADLNRRGGDIDLWIELEIAPANAERSVREFRLGLPGDWEDQKLDLKVTGRLSKLDSATQTFLNGLFPIPGGRPILHRINSSRQILHPTRKGQ
ncbi:MAG TPA: hypothetical protein VNJ01_13800, partial [Bacteriovoracaceae bacterium]|nr:hypothetical protein [Bacteriovoracaceae bacterium]